MLKLKSEQMLMLLTCSALVATALPETVDEFDLDDFSFELPISSNEDETTRIDSQLSKACANQLTPFEVVEILTSSNPPFGLPPVQVQNFLAQNESFYKFTNPPVVRELHDIPTLMPFQYHCAPSWAFSANAFYQQTRKVSLTQNHPQIGCYLNLNLPDILALIENDEIPADEIPSVVGIIGRNLTVEERRFGAMLDVWKHYKRWIFTAALPVYIIERNFFLSQAVQDQLLESPLFIGGGGLPGYNFDNFTTQHLERDRAGIGDLRLQLLFNCAPQKSASCSDDQACGSGSCATDMCREQQIHVGGQITFPTAHAAITGVFGGQSKICKPPLINFFEILNLAFCTTLGDKESKLNLFELGTGYGIAAIDQLAETILDTSLGQQHFNLGPIFHYQQPFRCKGNFWSSFEFYGEMKYYIPGNETRFLKVVTDPAAFNRDYASEADADSNLLFLDQEMTNYFFPAIVKIKTKPGLMFHTNVALNGFWQEWEAGIGYDFWAQLKESFGKLKCQASGYGTTLDYCAGRKFTAYESKIFGQFGMRLCGVSGYAMRFLVRADTTIQHKGIGNSFNLALNFIIDY